MAASGQDADSLPRLQEDAAAVFQMLDRIFETSRPPPSEPSQAVQTPSAASAPQLPGALPTSPAGSAAPSAAPSAARSGAPAVTTTGGFPAGQDPAQTSWSQSHAYSARQEPIRELLPVTGAQRAERYGRDPFAKEDHVLPIADVLRGLQATERPAVARRTPTYLLYVLLFASSVSLALDAPSVFEIQRGVLRSLAEQPIPSGTFGPGGAFNATSNELPPPRVVFYNVSTLAEFWTWASEVLYPQVYQQGSFNNLEYALPSNTTANFSLDELDNTTANLSVNGSLDVFAVAKYNRLVTPIRFRQLRSKQDQCDVPAVVSSLSQPCWGQLDPIFGAARTEGEMRLEPGQSAIPGGTEFFSEGLSVLIVDREVHDLPFMDGHVVDLELNSSLALEKLRGMISDRWTDEWTRTIAIDLNTYNPAYGMASSFRFQMHQTIGGRLSGHVEACTCTLDPYFGLWGEIRMITEGCWIVFYLFYLALSLRDVLRRRSLEFFGSYYAMIEWINIVMHGVVISGVVVWFLEDKDAFRRQHDREFKDLYSLCEKYQYSRNFAAFSAVWLFMQILLRIKNYSRFRLIWLMLITSVRVLVPISVSVVIAATPFAFAGYWLFGSRVYAFSTFSRAYGFLFRSTIGGFIAESELTSSGSLTVMDEMRQVDPFLADAWSISWVVLSKFILYGVFVACVVHTFHVVRHVWRQRKLLLKERGSYKLRFFFFANILEKFTNPEIHEPAEMYIEHMEVWNRMLGTINRAKLEEIVAQALRSSRRHLEVTDLIPLFRRRADNEFDACRQATRWLKALCVDLELDSRRKQKRSTSMEVESLLRKVARLEEETVGLTVQLQALAEVPLAAPI